MAPRLTWLTLLGLGVLLAARPAWAQATSDELTYSQKQVFRIPFQADPGPPRLKEVQLYYSTDQGRTWQPSGSAAPDKGLFTFTADHDGLYWFAVRTVDLDGRPYPLSMDGARPGLRVVVDSQPPVIGLRALPPRDGMVGVAWDIRDDNLDLSSLSVDYRLPTSAEWRPLRVDVAAAGQYSWRPETNGTLDVRLQVRDRAGNAGDKVIPVSAGTDYHASAEQLRPEATRAPAAAGPAVRMVNSKHISLNYEVKEKGRSGVSVVELWYTQDGRNWQKYDEKPYNPPYVIDVSDEGLYGFTLVVRSGVGLSERPPQVGDPPQVWVEVDLTKPVVRLQGVEVGRGADSGKLTIVYQASDKNLARQPITLSFAETAAGPWKPIVTSVENQGRYVWQMPQEVPYQFLVRVEAADRAGNIGTDETVKAVAVDLALPKGVILEVAPAK
jgi:hypothetical protein